MALARANGFGASPEEDDRLERLLPAFGQQVARGGGWPRPGDSVLIKEDWDGCAAHNSPHFLILAAGERVLVSHKNLDGFLFGTVEGAASMPERSGWFGGRGCSAAVEVVLPVPLGPYRQPRVLPEGIPPYWADGMEPADAAEASQGGGSRPSGADSLDAVVAEYCRSNNVDGSAASALRELEPDLQRILLTRNLSNCRNPSAVLLTRIDRVKAGQPMNPGGPGRGRSRSPRRASPGLGPPGGWSGASAGPAQVEEFISRWSLDDRAARQLRDLPLEMQTQAMEADLAGCRNPSAVLQSRIRSVQAVSPAVASSFAGSSAPSAIRDDPAAERAQAPPPQERQSTSEVEAYITRNNIQPAVANMLRALAPSGQEQIINADLSGCRNPSQVLQSRIRSVEATLQFGGAVKLPVKAPRPPPPDSPLQPPPPGSDTVEAFAERNELDAEATNALYALPPDMQRLVLERGDLSGARNPSRVVLSRIRNVENGLNP